MLNLEIPTTDRQENASTAYSRQCQRVRYVRYNSYGERQADYPYMKYARQEMKPGDWIKKTTPQADEPHNRPNGARRTK